MDEVLEQCDNILASCDEIPEEGEEFTLSVSEKVESIRDWCKAHGGVTEAQQQALDNMEAGVDRWLRH